MEAYEHGMALSIVALRGSVPTQWVLDFRQGLGRCAGLLRRNAAPFLSRVPRQVAATHSALHATSYCCCQEATALL